MANENRNEMNILTRICLRHGDSTEWETVNPVLRKGELGIDSRYKRLKAGDGETAWNDLDFLYDDTVNGAVAALSMIAQLVSGESNFAGIVTTTDDLADTFPYPTENDVALVYNENKLYKFDGEDWNPVTLVAISGGGDVTAEQIQTMATTQANAMSNAFGFGGISYTFTGFNSAERPTGIAFGDSTTAAITYDGTGRKVQQIVYTHADSTTETVTYNYDGNGRFLGTTVA